MANIQNYLTPKIDRGGIKYKFGWVNVTTQAPLVKLLGLDAAAVPRVILLNPGKRKRYFVMDDAINEAELSNNISITIKRSFI